MKRRRRRLLARRHDGRPKCLRQAEETAAIARASAETAAQAVKEKKERREAFQDGFERGLRDQGCPLGVEEREMVVGQTARFGGAILAVPAICVGFIGAFKLVTYCVSRVWRIPMNTPLKILGAAALLLLLLFVAPVVYRTGQRVGLYLNCPYDDNELCWGQAGLAVMHGGRMPRR